MLLKEYTSYGTNVVLNYVNNLYKGDLMWIKPRTRSYQLNEQNVDYCKEWLIYFFKLSSCGYL